ncbi:hypothetical protein BDZ89DRAFT_278625 [Hymenopellis radicata]|nr:hypothetical protein BDZ89DRAFT_278625 [Hymenopellis radicata]
MNGMPSYTAKINESCAGPISGSINVSVASTAFLCCILPSSCPPLPTTAPPRMTAPRRGMYLTTTSLMKMPSPTTRVASPTLRMKKRSAQRRIAMWMGSLRFFDTYVQRMNGNPSRQATCKISSRLR